MRKYLIYILLCLITISCTVRPRAVLTQREMASVITDLHRAEGTLLACGHASSAYDEENAHYYEAILAKHNLTQAQFDSSLAWYTAHPKQFQRVYPKVIKQLQKEKDIVEEARQELLQQHVTKRVKLPPYNLDSLYNRFHQALDTTLLKVEPLQPDTSTIPFAYQIKEEE